MNFTSFCYSVLVPKSSYGGRFCCRALSFFKFGRKGASLVEMVLAIALFGALVLTIALFVIKIRQSGSVNRRMLQASCIAQSQLEKQLALSVEKAAIGKLPPIKGEFSDGNPCETVVEYYSLGGTGVAAGLSDSEIKGIRVTVTWIDSIGNHECHTESYVSKIPR
jgi:uncharacterized membrane protein